MHKRKIRKHHSGVANFLIQTQPQFASGETFYDTMRRTMTQSLNKQLPTISQKYSSPIIVDPRTFTQQKFPKRKLSMNYREVTSQKRKRDDREESYKNDVQQTKPVLFTNREGQNSKLKDVQKLLRRKYANRKKMFNIFNGWDGQPKGYIDHQNLQTVLKLMGINLNQSQSKQFIKMYSPNQDKLNLNDFLNIIYSEQTEQKGTKAFTQTSQSAAADSKFRVNFDQQQKDCSNLKLQNMNQLDSYQLNKALFEGQKIKNRLQKYLLSPQDAQIQLFSDQASKQISFQNVQSSLISFLKIKQGHVKWRQLQGFLSLFQYNVNKQLNSDELCQAIFDNQTICQRSFIRKNPPPINSQERLAKSTHLYSSHSRNLSDCLKKIDQQVFRASASYEKVFQKFDRDKDGFISEQDFVNTMKVQNLLTQNEAKQVFNYIGGKNGKYQNCLTFKQFSDGMKPGMGTQQNDQYPNFLRPKKIGQFRNFQRTTKSGFFDPKCVTNLDQRKTRFNGNPTYQYSTLGADGTKFWGKSGDLNAKVQFQKEQKQKIQNIQKQKYIERAENRLADDKRRQTVSEFEDMRQICRLQKMSELKGAYERANHKY